MRDPVHGSEWGVGARYLEQHGGWHWAEPRGPEHFRRCSYCGCINPEDLVAETGWHAEWADRKYGYPHKFYVGVPDKLGKLDWLGGTSGGSPQSVDELRAEGYIPIGELTPEQREVCERARVDVSTYQGVKLGVRREHFGKFYTVHLADPDLDPAVKNEVERRCGQVFEWLDGGRVRWRPYNYTELSGSS